MDKVKNISGVILAGGASSRFGGETKSKMNVGGISIISRMVTTLSDIFGEIIIVTNRPEEFRDFKKCKIVQDEYKNTGPLGGIHAAMTGSDNPVVFVFAGDMPFINKEVILSQIEAYRKLDCDVLVPRIDSYNEPLHAIYRLSTFIKLDYFLSQKQGNAIKDFLAKVEVRYLDFEQSPVFRRVFTNINTPSDLSAANNLIQQNSNQNN